MPILRKTTCLCNDTPAPYYNSPRPPRPRRMPTHRVKSLYREEIAPAGRNSEIFKFNMVADRGWSCCFHSVVLCINGTGGRAATEMGDLLVRADAGGVCRAHI